MVFNPRRLSGNWSKQLRNEASRASSTRTPAKNPISRSVGIRHLAAATCFNTNCGILDSLCPDHYPCKRDSIALRTSASTTTCLTASLTGDAFLPGEAFLAGAVFFARLAGVRAMETPDAGNRDIRKFCGMREGEPCYTDRANDTVIPIFVVAYAMRTDSGRPSSSIRFSAWTMITTCGAVVPAPVRKVTMLADAFETRGRHCHVNRDWQTHAVASRTVLKLPGWRPRQDDVDRIRPRGQSLFVRSAFG